MYALVVESATAHAVDVDAAARLGVPVRALVAAGAVRRSGGAPARRRRPSRRPSSGRPDVCWDEIVVITPTGDEQVYDLTVPGLAQLRGRRRRRAQHRLRPRHGHPRRRRGRRCPVLFFSLEMGHAELTLRILSAEARVDSQKMRTGRLSEQDWSKIGRAIGRLEAPLFIDDNPNVTVMEIRAKARRLAQRYGDLGLVVVDYLQLMTGPLDGREPPGRGVARSAGASRSWPASWRCRSSPCRSSSRNLESRADKRPMLADLRESRLDRAGRRRRDVHLPRRGLQPGSTDRGVAEIIVAKHRNGPIGSQAARLPRRRTPASTTPPGGCRRRPPPARARQPGTEESGAGWA